MSDDDNKVPQDNLHQEEPALNTFDNSDGFNSPSQNKPPSHAKQVWLGIGLLTLLHLLLFAVPVAFFFISVAQLVYLIPALILFRKNKGLVQGLLIGAGITFLLNAACFGLLLGGNLRL
ncbi:hypothetical protein [Paenibacillus rigui]|uniref:Uncharacterized protein n=1 Tax=Paenibacillus rigui TaxID=554312 RepID=A0A229UKF2_9BACL|nr:hypothetical protein [Paenibacillus rigui]OXM83851.1 hypothetical protein CF651_23350 [Paenibacillus rigui]